MSTYTDLHNRLKENLTILRFPGNKEKDGLCPQRVILVNPENQFYGTFNGQMNITEGTLSGLKIVGGKIEGADVTDANFNGVSLQELTSNVSKIEQGIQDLDNDLKTLSGSHTQLSNSVTQALADLDSGIEQKINDIVDQLTGSSQSASKEISALSRQLSDLNDNLHTLSSNIVDAVIYRGTLALDRKVYTKPYEVLQSVCGGRCCLIDEAQQGDLYSNGWMWRVAFNRVSELSDPSIIEVEVKDTDTSSKITLTEGDFIILKNVRQHQTVLSDITLYDLNIINAQDRDVVKIQTLNDISSFLMDHIDGVQDTLETQLELSSGQLESLIDNINLSVSDLQDRVTSDYVDKHEAEIEKLSVTGALEAFGPTTISNSLFVDDDYTTSSGTKVQISEDGIIAKTHSGIEVEADDDITIKNTEDIHVIGNQLDIITERGLETLSVNGKSLQSTLDELASKKFDISSASDLSTSILQIVDDADYITDLSLAYDKNAKQLVLSAIPSRSFSVDVEQFSTGEELISSISAQLTTLIGQETSAREAEITLLNNNIPSISSFYQDGIAIAGISSEASGTYSIYAPKLSIETSTSGISIATIHYGDQSTTIFAPLSDMSVDISGLVTEDDFKLSIGNLTSNDISTYQAIVQLSDGANLSNYYEKTETSSSSEISTKFNDYYTSAETISAIEKAISNITVEYDLSELSDYLPLSGGTMKGDIELGGNASNFENSHAITFENGKIILADGCGNGPGLGFMHNDGPDKVEGRYLFNDMGAESSPVEIDKDSYEVVRSKDVYAALSNYASLSDVPTIEVSSIYGQSEPGTTKIASISVNGNETGIYAKESQGDSQLRQDILNALSGLPNVNQLDVDSGISEIQTATLSIHMILSNLYDVLKNG